MTLFLTPFSLLHCFPLPTHTHTHTLYLVNSDDVSQKGQKLDLHGHEVHIHLLVEGGSLPHLQRWLQSDGLHGEGDELCHRVVHRLLVELWQGVGGGGRRGGRDKHKRGGGSGIKCTSHIKYRSESLTLELNGLYMYMYMYILYTVYTLYMYMNNQL